VTGPVARLLGSLANALLDLGLPSIRQWLRDRLGPAADVTQVTTDGELVHLDGVRVPVGPRGLLVLERASAVITALGRAGLPEMRLHAFKGVLAFGDEARAFRADVAFSALPEPEEAAWIWGELEILRASWPAREGSPRTNPMQGRARLFVSSREWRLEGGSLDGEIVHARFAGGGEFDISDGAAAEELLVPRALSSGALTLDHARVGPFIDAVSALAGSAIAVPSFVPLDAQLDGELAWTTEQGGRVDLRIASESVGASVRGAIAPDGSGLGVRVDADASPAALLRRVGGPREALPRDEDVVRFELTVSGDLRHPVVNGAITASELGFRLGRPRFVPPVVVRALTSELFLKDERAVLRAVARARGGEVTLDLDANIRDLGSAHGTLRADALDAAFVRDVLATLGGRLGVPNDVAASAELTLAPRAGASGLSIAGAATLATSSSRVVFTLNPSGDVRIAGSVTVHDVLATGALSGSVRPVEGELVVALDLVRGDAFGLRGTVASPRLVVALVDRPEIPPYLLESATVNVVIDSAALVYDQLRFRAHGGRFVAHGRLALASERSNEAPLFLHLEEGGAELAEALAHLAIRKRPSADTGASAALPALLRMRAAREGVRPPEEIWLPRALTAHGHLILAADLALDVEVMLETPAGTAASLVLRRVRGGALDGSTLCGSLAVSDLVASGVLGSKAPITSEGILEIDALARGHGDGIVVAGWIGADRITVARGPSFVLADLTALWRVDHAGVKWNELSASAYGGTLSSSGTFEGSGALRARASFSSIAVHDLPELSGRAPASFVRGALSGTVIARWDGSFRAVGELLLDHAAFPALDLVRPTLARYGLRPPNEDATAPVSASIVGTDRALSFRDVKLDLRGAIVRGELRVTRDRTLDGRAEVTLEEEYLRTSKVLTLPRVLTERLVLPVRVLGPLDRPRVHGDLAGSLGRFLKDNRVSAFVTSAVEEAQILFGRQPATEPSSAPPPPPIESDLDAELRDALDAHAAEWTELAARAPKRRYRAE
jgi:hypothetical protein